MPQGMANQYGKLYKEHISSLKVSRQDLEDPTNDQQECLGAANAKLKAYSTDSKAWSLLHRGYFGNPTAKCAAGKGKAKVKAKAKAQ